MQPPTRHVPLGSWLLLALCCLTTHVIPYWDSAAEATP